MNVKEIIDFTRSTILSDTKKPYKWQNIELIVALNKGLNEFCRETLCLVDQTTASITQIKLLSNLGYYPLDNRVIRVKSARLASNGTPLIRKTEDWMDQYFTNWRDVTGSPVFYSPDRGESSLSVYRKYDAIGEVLGSSNISFDQATKKISKPGATFTSHYAIGDSINVSGTTNNNGYFTIAAVTDTEITVNESLVNEVNTSAVLRKVRDTLLLAVHRIPLTPFTDHDLELSSPPSPEIKAMYHDSLPDGIAKMAFLKPDSQSFDKAKAEHHRQLFQLAIDKAKDDLLRLTAFDQTNRPHPGAI